LWWLVQGPPPDEWSQDEQRAFLAWRGDIEIDVPQKPMGGAMIAPIPAALADEVMIERRWLQNIVHLLNEKRQVVFYGPPGTGKTFLARRIAEHAVAGGGAWELVQFHPAYAYEDFVEGYRPTGSGTVEFKVRWGILRRLADAARKAPDKPHVLVIDEINRGNLAKIFGELFFLLEYRDRPIRLQYSPEEEFELPDNLFVIGTMNTADRSIALVDSALRRRFYFVPFSPLAPPIDALLGKWLDREGYSRRPAELLAALNEALAETPGIGEEFAIGPSYFMTRSGEPNVERVWEYSILPLLVERLYGAKTEGEIAAEYSIAEIGRRLDNGAEEPPMGDEAAADTQP
jgi:5-methylcytosine-specific restriction protein B